MADTCPLEFRVHLVSGHCWIFRQDDPDTAAAFLSDLKPTKVFNPAQIVISETGSLSVIPSPSVARLEILGPTPIPISFDQYTDDMQVISADEFRERYDPEKLQREIRDAQERPGTPIKAFAIVETLDGYDTHLEIQARSRPKLDRMMTMRQVFAAPCLPARIPGRGVLLIQTRHITTLTLYPGQPERPPLSWPARFVSLGD